MQFVFLGSSGAVPSSERDTTALVFAADEEAVLVDCGGSPLQKLLRAGVDPATLVRVIITHIHPDHAYGLPALVQSLLLLGRTAPLRISCRTEHVEPLRAVLDAFQLLERPRSVPIVFEAVPARADFPIARTAAFVITASPNEHGSMPNMALRFAAPTSPRAVVYSSDTGPCEAVIALARGADTLIHEATFSEQSPERYGAHSSAAEAGEIAERAGVRRLILTHIDAEHHHRVEALAAEARARFGGLVEVARELVPYPL
jgi:ribonuclease Z